MNPSRAITVRATESAKKRNPIELNRMPKTRREPMRGDIHTSISDRRPAFDPKRFVESQPTARRFYQPFAAARSPCKECRPMKWQWQIA
jgi:hypothetical protein